MIMESSRDLAGPHSAAETTGHDARPSNTRSSSNASQQDRDSNDADVSSTEKTAAILAACRWRDISRLRTLAEAEGGFLNDALRRRACKSGSWYSRLDSIPVAYMRPSSKGPSCLDSRVQPMIPMTAYPTPVTRRAPNWILLLATGRSCRATGMKTKSSLTSTAPSSTTLTVSAHGAHVSKLAKRTRANILSHTDQSEAELTQHKSELSALINEVLRRYPYLCYFQGYHDICQVFLLVLHPAWRAQVVARLSILRIRDFMLPSFGPTTTQLRLLPDILAKADPKLRRHVADVEPFYALAGTLTMYSHNIEGYRDIARLFDVLLAREPVFSIYMFAQIILDRRDEIFEYDEPDMLHVILGRVPPKMNLDELIVNSAKLFDQYPPETLPSWSQISSSSVLKTARNVEACSKQSLEEAEQYFQRQVKELQWVELYDKVKLTLWTYRRPAKALGVAVAVGVAAIYIRRNPSLMNHISAFFS